jgi:hypothetical protein
MHSRETQRGADLGEFFNEPVEDPQRRIVGAV